MLHRMRKVKEPIATQKPRKSSKGQRVGYVRASTLDQNENRQLEGIELDRTFLDAHHCWRVGWEDAAAGGNEKIRHNQSHLDEQSINR